MDRAVADEYTGPLRAFLLPANWEGRARKMAISQAGAILLTNHYDSATGNLKLGAHGPEQLLPF